jgi:heat shock protein HtpX
VETHRVLDPQIRRRQRLRNGLQEILLLGGLVVLAAGLAWLLFGLPGLIVIAALGVVLLVIRARMPTRTVLRMYGARPLPNAAAPQLHRIVEELVERARLPAAPTLYYIASRVMNAFAVGRGDDAVLAVTDGLLRGLSSREGVLAHEVSHVRAGDTTVMSLSDAISRIVQGLSYFGLLSILFSLPMTLAGHPQLLLLSGMLIFLPLIVTLLQLALSRSREFDADLEGAILTGDPEGLALEDLDRSTGRLWERIMVPRGRVPDPLLLRTHPSTAERTRRLRELVPGDAARQLGDHRPAPPVDRPPSLGPARLRFPGIRW